MREYLVKINEKSYKVIVKDLGVDAVEMEINGKSYSVKYDEFMHPDLMSEPSSPTPSSLEADPAVSSAPAESPDPAASSAPAESPDPEADGDSGLATVEAPIPGSILGILCAEGDKITVGQSVVKMEAMKMENEIKTEIGGTVAMIQVKPGDVVNQGDDLIVVNKDV